MTQPEERRYVVRAWTTMFALAAAFWIVVVALAIKVWGAG